MTVAFTPPCAPCVPVSGVGAGVNTSPSKTSRTQPFIISAVFFQNEIITAISATFVPWVLLLWLLHLCWNSSVDLQIYNSTIQNIDIVLRGNYSTKIKLSWFMRSIEFQFLLLLTMCVIETCRVMSGWKGNLTESKGSIGISLVLLVPAVLSSVYVLVFQSYVLR